MKNLFKFSLAILCSVVIASCGGRKTVNDVDPDIIDGGVMVTTVPLDGQGGIAGENLGGVGDPLSKRTIYFDYNSSLLTQESDLIVRAHAQYLTQAPGVRVTLQGHADERGTREYNLALGEDRAKTAATVINALGVAWDRIENVSYGEERPVASGHDDSSWSLNRRVEILYH